MKNTTRRNTLRRRQNVLPRYWKTALATALCAAACSQVGLAQVAAPSILQIDIANHVLYFNDTSDVANYGTDPNAATTLHAGSFGRGVAIADIVAVNGQRVMRTHTKDAGGNSLRTGPGQGIADTVRNGLAVATFEILKSDGTPIGTIFVTGLAGGDAPPGSPLTVAGNNFDYRWYGSISRRSGADGGGGQPAGSSCPTGSLHDRGPREPTPKRRWNTTVDSLFDPDVGAANCDHCQRPGRDPFQRLLSCYFV
jgi:hypothetical protein